MNPPIKESCCMQAACHAVNFRRRKTGFIRCQQDIRPGQLRRLSRTHQRCLLSGIGQPFFRLTVASRITFRLLERLLLPKRDKIKPDPFLHIHKHTQPIRNSHRQSRLFAPFIMRRCQIIGRLFRIDTSV